MGAEPGTGNCSSQSIAYDKATGDCLALISAGTSPFDSGLLSASSNGKDVYFFTRDSLAPQDKNGDTMKIYDAREGGGFPYELPRVQCQASDECHGAGSPLRRGKLKSAAIAGAPTANCQRPGKLCEKGFVKKYGTCVQANATASKDTTMGQKRHHHRGGPSSERDAPPPRRHAGPPVY